MTNDERINRLEDEVARLRYENKATTKRLDAAEATLRSLSVSVTEAISMSNTDLGAMTEREVAVKATRAVWRSIVALMKDEDRPAAVASLRTESLTSADVLDAIADATPDTTTRDTMRKAAKMAREYNVTVDEVEAR